MKRKPDFEADRKGLRRILERRGKEFALLELIQNALDEDGVTQVDVALKPLPNRPMAHLRVEDDSPTGFRDLTDGFTLFADSYKRKHVDKRGRFNFGEKLVVAICSTASLSTTTGTILWGENGRAVYPRRKRARGTVFEADIRMTREEVDESLRVARAVIPTATINIIINGVPLPSRDPLATLEAVLQTEHEDADGNLKPTRRKTAVQIFEPLPGETPTLYELGLPLMPISDRWHYDIGQKVPVTLDRTNVTPGFLRDVRTLVLNSMTDFMGVDDAAEKWVNDALEDEKVTAEAVKKTLELRFGSKHVIHDLSDLEANDIAKSQGYTIIPPRALSAAAWTNVRRFEAAQPAGRVTPSPKPYEFGVDGRPINVVPEEKWNDAIRRVVAYTQALHQSLLETGVTVVVVNEPTRPFGACYCANPIELQFNLGRLGYRWFEGEVTGPITQLLLHEFGHFFEGNHLNEKFHEAICIFGTRLLKLGLEQPDFFERFVECGELSDITTGPTPLPLKEERRAGHSDRK